MHGDSVAVVSSWVKELTIRKSQAIREQLGHVTYDKRIDSINESASRAFLDKINRSQQQATYDIGGPMIINPLQSMH